MPEVYGRRHVAGRPPLGASRFGKADGGFRAPPPQGGMAPCSSTPNLFFLFRPRAPPAVARQLLSPVQGATLRGATGEGLPLTHGDAPTEAGLETLTVRCRGISSRPDPTCRPATAPAAACVTYPVTAAQDIPLTGPGLHAPSVKRSPQRCHQKRHCRPGGPLPDSPPLMRPRSFNRGIEPRTRLAWRREGGFNGAAVL
jgi:hypothetical protein